MARDSVTGPARGHSNASGLIAVPANPLIMDARSYVVVLEPEPAGGYSAHIPAFRGAHTQGDTIEETLSNARDVITGYVEILAERGEPIPPSDLRARNDKLRHLRDAVDAGVADVEAGRTKPLTDELLRAIAQRGRRLSKVRRSGPT